MGWFRVQLFEDGERMVAKKRRTQAHEPTRRKAVATQKP